MKIKKKVAPNIIWKIQAGNLSFWWDNWKGYGAMSMVVQDQRKSAKVQVKHYIFSGTWDTIKLNDTLPAHIGDTISKTTVGNINTDDFPIWNISENDLFSNNSAWHSIRARRKKMSSSLETMQHVFNGSDTTQFIWNEIGKPLGMKHQLEPIIRTFKRWWDTKTTNTIHKQIMQIEPTIICWEMWKQWTLCRYGNKNKFNNNVMKYQGVWTIKQAIAKVIPGIDSKSNSNNMIEVLAAEFGVKWCSHHGFTDFVLELDSLVIVNMLTKKEADNIKIKQIVDNIINSINDANVRMQNCLRKGNQVADCLAKLAATSNQAKIFQNFQYLYFEYQLNFSLNQIK
uniref:Uncharacterized protein LOC104224736 n=1 Tax=Nicotiana sylvestris TaxID=4096 RepID=A0A1U7WJA8_NICSY|nr:PREDICTED: uncharacterized protein LOC104224736 [Nicotiana sylvestris]